MSARMHEVQAYLHSRLRIGFSLGSITPRGRAKRQIRVRSASPGRTPCNIEQGQRSYSELVGFLAQMLARGTGLEATERNTKPQVIVLPFCNGSHPSQEVFCTRFGQVDPSKERPVQCRTETCERVL